MTTVVAFGGLFALSFSSDFSSDEKLKLATRWLDEGRLDLAGRVVQELEDQVDIESNSTWNYVHGVTQLKRIADDLDSYKNRAILREVTEKLEKCREIGFPVAQRGKGNYYLGLCQFNTYQWDEAIEALSDSLVDYPQVRSDSLRMILAANLRKSKPDVNAAQATLDRWLRMPGLSKRELAQTRLARAQLAIHQGHADEAANLLKEVEPGIPEYFEALKWQARNLIDDATGQAANSEDGKESLKKAQAILQKLTIASDTPLDIRRQAIYLAGLALRKLGRLDEAIGTFSGVRQLYPLSAEAIAAALEEAEVLLELGRTSDVANATMQLLKEISDIRLYNEYWIPAAELTSRLFGITNQLCKSGMYELALEVADQMQVVFPANQAMQLQANILGSWSRAFESQARHGDVQAKASLNNLYNRTGQKYEQVASSSLRANDYLDLVWNAIEYYQRAGRTDSANRMIETYLNYEARTRRPRGLLALARNHLANGDWQASLVPLERCFEEHPASPSGYEARLLAARSLKELNELDKAIELLSVNLWDCDLHPENPLWKESFSELGTLQTMRADKKMSEVKKQFDLPWKEAEPNVLQCQKDFSQAIETLNEAIRRYPSDPQIGPMRFRLARNYQLTAELNDQVARRDESLNELNRRQLAQQHDELLENAVNQYGELLKGMRELPDDTRKSTLNSSISRNSYLNRADILMQLGKYDEAIDAYREALAAYSNRPEGLEALTQIAECYRKSGREREALKAIHQAELMLDRIPVDQNEFFVSLTRGDRTHWQALLKRLKQWN